MAKITSRQHPVDPDMFWCPGCQQYKNKDEFGKSKRLPNGIAGICRKCKNLQGKKYYENNRAIIIARTTEYARNNPGKRNSGTQKAWAKNNPEKVKLKAKTYYEVNKEKCLLATKIYKQTNQDKIRASHSEWVKNNRDMINNRLQLNRINLSNGYIKRILRDHYGVKGPSDELIELKRQSILLKRTLKEFKKWREEHESIS